MVAVSYKTFSGRFRILKGMTGERTAGKLQGKIALVTGGSSGIGFATAKQFIGEGAFVQITGRRQPELDRAVTTLGIQAKSVRADASKLEDLDALYAQIQQKKGHLDVLFVNAGGGSFAPLSQITEGQVDEVFERNVKGFSSPCKALPLIPAGGAIVSVQGVPSFTVYSASKAAVRSLARGWANDLKDRKIGVDVVSPGPVDTPELSGLAQTEDASRRYMSSSPPTYHSAALDSRKRSRRRRSFWPPKMQASSPALNCSLTVAPSRSDVRDSAERNMEKKR